MKAILITPLTRTTEYITLQDDYQLYDREVRKLLNTEKYFGVTDGTETVQIVSDAFSLKKDTLAIELDVFPVPIFGTFLITGWNAHINRPVSIPEDFTINSLSVQFFDQAQSKIKKNDILKMHKAKNN